MRTPTAEMNDLSFFWCHSHPHNLLNLQNKSQIKTNPHLLFLQALHQTLKATYQATPNAHIIIPHYIHKMAPQILDAGVANKSVSASFMKLVNVHHEMDTVDFDQVVKFLEENLDNVINDVHKMDKLMLDDGEVRA